MTASASGANSPHDQWIYISTPSVNPINFTVKKPDGTTFFSGQVSNADSQEFSAGPNGFNGNLFVRDFETEQILTNAGFIIEAETLKSIKDNRDRITILSKERMLDEFEKILLLNDKMFFCLIFFFYKLIDLLVHEQHHHLQISEPFYLHVLHYLFLFEHKF